MLSKLIPPLFLTTALMLLVGCGGNELTASEVPDGFVSFEDRSYGFSISDPKTWIDRSAEDVRSIQRMTVLATQRSPHPSLKDLAPEQLAKMTDLWFVAEGGTRGVDWSDVTINACIKPTLKTCYDDTLRVRAGI